MEEGIQNIAIAVLLLATISLLGTLVSPKSIKHRKKRRKAIAVYEKVQLMENSRIIPYLRKIDPYVFEELVLYAFQKKGYSVYRNRRYSGDGGIDGKVKIDGEKVLIQDKRYSDYICMSHVQDFDRLCRKRHKNGLFIHTGKTGQGTKEVAFESPRISIVSGSKLVSLMKK